MEVSRVLLTGSQGFLGSQLTEMLLSAGFELRTQDLAGSYRLGHIQGDLSCPEVALRAVSGMDAVLHLAGAKPQDQDVYQKNLASIKTLISACHAEGVKRCFFASTINIYGQGSFKVSRRIFTPAYFPIDERIPTDPEDDYSLSKLRGEELFEEATRLENLHVLALRLPGIWSQEHTESYRPEKSLRLSPLQIIDPWHYLDIRDLARAITAYLRRPSVPRFFLGYITAADHSSWLTTQDLLGRDCPEWLNLWASPPVGHQPLFSSSAVSALLNWHPLHHWRDVPQWRHLLAKTRSLLP